MKWRIGYVRHVRLDLGRIEELLLLKIWLRGRILEEFARALKDRWTLEGDFFRPFFALGSLHDAHLSFRLITTAIGTTVQLLQWRLKVTVSMTDLVPGTIVKIATVIVDGALLWQVLQLCLHWCDHRSINLLGGNIV